VWCTTLFSISKTFFLKDFTIEIKAEKQLAYDKPTSDRVIRRNNEEFFLDKEKIFCRAITSRLSGGLEKFSFALTTR
jgi:hypothetical protein